MKFILLIVCTFLPCLLFSQHRVHLVDGKEDQDFSNFLSIKNGARVIASSNPGLKGFLVHNMIDDTKGPSAFWRTTPKEEFPHWVVIELPRPQSITTIVVNTGYLSENEYPGVSPSRITIEISNTSAKDGFEKVGRIFPKKLKNGQIFYINAVEGRWIKFWIEANYNHPVITEVGRIYAYNDVSLNEYEMQLSVDKKLEVFNIHFATASAKIEESSLAVIEGIAEILESNKDWKMVIEGHTDSEGSAAANMDLSWERAQAVVEALIELGIAGERLKAQGFGEEKALSTSNTKDAQAMNRRVTFRLIED